MFQMVLYTDLVQSKCLPKNRTTKLPPNPDWQMFHFLPPLPPLLWFLSIEVPQQIKAYLAAIQQHLLDGMFYLIILQHNGMALQFVNE